MAYRKVLLRDSLEQVLHHPAFAIAFGRLQRHRKPNVAELEKRLLLRIQSGDVPERIVARLWPQRLKLRHLAHSRKRRLIGE